VTRALFKTRVEGGILGDIRFDNNGDLVEGPVTIYCIVRPDRGSHGMVVDRVVTARAAVPPQNEQRKSRDVSP